MDITNQSIQSYLDTLDPNRLEAIQYLVEEMRQVTQLEPKLWGTIIGFGKLYYKYKTGHDGYMPIIGLSSRKQAITLYLSFDIEQYPELQSLGKITYSKGCLYIKKLSDVNLAVLRELIRKTAEDALKHDFIQRIE